MRQYDSGATRSPLGDKLQYKGFRCPQVEKSFALYMHEHRTQADGNIRDADNWKKGMDKEDCADSLIRHCEDFHSAWEGWEVICPDTKKKVSVVELLNAMKFNINAIIRELIKETT